MVEYICKRCKAKLYNGRFARDHMRKEHGITKNLKSYYKEDDGKSMFKKMGERVAQRFLYKEIKK